MYLKTIVPKQGNIESYIDKPLLDRISVEYTPYGQGEPIGVITSAIEVEEGYELTIRLFEPLKMESIGSKVTALSFK